MTNGAGALVRITLTLLIVAFLAGPLAACGKKGALDPPDKVKSSYPRTYPTR